MLGPDILAPELDEQAFLRRLREDDPTRADRRRAARPADHRRDRQPVEGRGLLRRRDRPVAAHRRRHRRGGARDPPRHPPADAAVRARRHAGALQGRLRHRRAGRARAAGSCRTSAHAGKATTTGRHTGVHDVSDEDGSGTRAIRTGAQSLAPLIHRVRSLTFATRESRSAS